MKLCEAYERRVGSSASAADRSRVASSSQSAQGAGGTGSIWLFLERDEIWALGEIVSAWAQGSLDAQSARLQFQYRVLRGRSAQNTRAMGLGAGPDGMSRSPGGGGLPGLGGRSGQDPLFDGFADTFLSGLFSALAAPGMNGQQEPPHEAFATIDAVFLCESYREARGVAMQELGLDGTQVLPDEVKDSFQTKARGIIDSAQGASTNSVWLELVRLCLCAEVLRHLKPSCSGRPAGPPPALMGQARSAVAMLGGGPTNTLTMSQSAGGVNILVVSSGFPDGHNSGSLRIRTPGAMTAFPGPDGRMGPGVRLDPLFLRHRVSSLLEVLLLGSLPMAFQEQMGMTAEEIQRYCPASSCEACDVTCCPVCLEDTDVGAAVRKLKCGHVLHVECCDAWLATADTCPTCRQKLREEVPIVTDVDH